MIDSLKVAKCTARSGSMTPNFKLKNWDPDVHEKPTVSAGAGERRLKLLNLIRRRLGKKTHTFFIIEFGKVLKYSIRGPSSHS